MSKKCKICGKIIPYSIIIDNKRRNLKNRTKCLDCLPFGSSPYSVSNLVKEEFLERKRKNTKDHYKRNKINIENKSKNRRLSLVRLIGGCQICGHDKPYNIAFHHIGFYKKEFDIDRRKCQYSWKIIKPELLKCVMICHNCHGDIHHDNIDCLEMHKELVKLIEPLDNWPE